MFTIKIVLTFSSESVYIRKKMNFKTSVLAFKFTGRRHHQLFKMAVAGKLRLIWPKVSTSKGFGLFQQLHFTPCLQSAESVFYTDRQMSIS